MKLDLGCISLAVAAQLLAFLLPTVAASAADPQATPAPAARSIAKPDPAPTGSAPRKVGAAAASQQPKVPPQMSLLMERRAALCKKNPRACGATSVRIDPSAAPTPQGAGRPPATAAKPAGGTAR